jgi:hypothetical protein
VANADLADDDDAVVAARIAGRQRPLRRPRMPRKSAANRDLHARRPKVAAEASADAFDVDDAVVMVAAAAEIRPHRHNNPEARASEAP